MTLRIERDKVRKGREDRYQRTPKTMTSRSKWRPLNSLAVSSLGRMDESRRGMRRKQRASPAWLRTTSQKRQIDGCSRCADVGDAWRHAPLDRFDPPDGPDHEGEAGDRE